MNEKFLRFRVEFITSEEDCDEVTGIINDEKKVVELYEEKEGKQEYKGFIPFSSIKKLEIIDEEESEEE
jgi:hypothetical protein